MKSREGVSKEAFDAKLHEITSELSPPELLAIGGVYAALSEYFNDEIIDELNEEEDDA